MRNTGDADVDDVFRLMSAEWVTALSSLATFVVVGASAIAALIQLRHMRNVNQLAVLNDVRHTMESAEFREAVKFVMFELPKRVDDAIFRQALLSRATPEWEKLMLVGNFFDQAGVFVKHRMVDRDLACDVWYGPVTRSWNALAPVIASQRARLGYRLWEDFEYLVVLCKRFRERYPLGTFPKNMQPLALPEPWPEVAAGQK